MLDWGWRVPFLLGVFLLFVGAYLRRNVDETPTYEASRQAAVDQPVVAGLPLGALAFGFTIFWTIAYYTLLAWMPSFTQRFAGLTPSAGAVVEHDRPDRHGDRGSVLGRAVGQGRPQAAADGERDQHRTARLSACSR